MKLKKFAIAMVTAMSINGSANAIFLCYDVWDCRVFELDGGITVICGMWRICENVF